MVLLPAEKHLLRFGFLWPCPLTSMLPDMAQACRHRLTHDLLETASDVHNIRDYCYTLAHLVRVITAIGSFIDRSLQFTDGEKRQNDQQGLCQSHQGSMCHHLDFPLELLGPRHSTNTSLYHIIISSCTILVYYILVPKSYFAIVYYISVLYQCTISVYYISVLYQCTRF